MASRPARSPVLLPVLAACIALVSACRPPEETAVRDAFQRFLEGLDKADASVLWSLADDETRAFFDDLAKEAREAVADVDARWPEAERAAARRSLGGDFIRDTTTGTSLFGAFLDPRRLQAPKDPAARTIDHVELTGARALVVLKSGETLEFQSDANGDWRTAIFLAPAREQPGIATLRENLATARANSAVLSGGTNGTAHEGTP